METHLTPASRFSRAASAVLDFVLLEGVNWILMLASSTAYWAVLKARASDGVEVGPITDVISPTVAQYIQIGLEVVISPIYYIYGHYKYRATLGKWLCGIELLDSKTLVGVSLSKSVGRFFAYALSYLPLGTGFLMAFFQPEKKALHDLICSTVCVQTPDSGFRYLFRMLKGHFPKVS